MGEKKLCESREQENSVPAPGGAEPRKQQYFAVLPLLSEPLSARVSEQKKWEDSHCDTAGQIITRDSGTYASLPQEASPVLFVRLRVQYKAAAYIFIFYKIQYPVQHLPGDSL